MKKVDLDTGDMLHEPPETVGDDWRSSAQAFLDKCKDEPPQKKRKLYRTSALEALRCMDHAMMVASGRGFGAFEIHPPMSLGAPSGWTGPLPPPPPVLSIALDQDGANDSLKFFAKYATPLLTNFQTDPSHRVNNDIIGAIKGAGLWDTALLCKVVWNSQFGPWESLGWYKKLDEMAKKAMQVSGANDLIYQAYLVQLAKDMGELHRVGEDSWGALIVRVTWPLA